MPVQYPVKPFVMSGFQKMRQFMDDHIFDAGLRISAQPDADGNISGPDAAASPLGSGIPDRHFPAAHAQRGFPPPVVTESIFENRFKYVDELTRMGAEIKVEGDTAIIDGVARYTGASITAPDLRAGAALVTAALAAEGFTIVENVKYIERGYEDFHIKLKNLGAQIELVNTDKEFQKFKVKIGQTA